MASLLHRAVGFRVRRSAHWLPPLTVAAWAVMSASAQVGCASDNPAPTASGGSSQSGSSGTGASGAGGEGGALGGAAGTGTGGSLCTSGDAGSGTSAEGGQAGASDVSVAWDWNGVVGTGQSLAVGQFGVPAKATTQPYGNLKLNTGTAAWPIDPQDPNFMLVPLTEPIGRPSTTYPSSYPTNIAGETPHAAMANQITALVMDASGGDFVGVHGEFGENGQCMTYLKKNATQMGVNGRAYQATLLETEAVARLAADAGKSYGVGAVIVTHGECDAGNSNYEADLFQLWSDYNTDIAAITGQTQDLLMIVSQQNSVNDHSASTLAQWKVGVDHPAQVVCSGPKYQYAYHAADHVHLETDGYEQLGEKYGQIYFERVILGHGWQPLQPTSVERVSARVLAVHFHVPVPPLVWETTFQAPHQSIAAWQAGNGFELRGSSGRISITRVEICGDAVFIESDADLPASNLFVGYALTGDATAMSSPFVGTFRWGLLRDSDPFVGSMTHKAQPNFAVAFELPVP